MPEQKISKVKLSNGKIYSFFDNDAIHYDEQGRLLVDNAVIDNLIINGSLSIEEINEMSVEEFLEENSYILAYNDYSKEIKKKAANTLLRDIGGYSAKVDDETCVLSLKLGKQ